MTTYFDATPFVDFMEDYSDSLTLLRNERDEWEEEKQIITYIGNGPWDCGKMGIKFRLHVTLNHYNSNVEIEQVLWMYDSSDELQILSSGTREFKTHNTKMDRVIDEVSDILNMMGFMPNR